MAVYVDPLSAWGGSAAFPYVYSCHLIADTTKELKSFAKKLGLKQEWIQTDGLVHFDLTKNMRRKACRLGAKEITFKELVKKMREKRNENGKK